MRRAGKRFLTAVLAAAMLAAGSMAAYAMPSDLSEADQYASQNPDYPNSLYWDGTTAHWNAAPAGAQYEVYLEKNGSMASDDTTSNTHLSYKTLMKQSGEYRFCVRTITQYGVTSAWSPYSEVHHVSGYSSSNHTGNIADGPGANQYTPAAAKYGWVQNSDGLWMWKNQDGSYAKSCFKNIDGNTYYFTDNGIMFDGWLNLNGNNYYFTYQTGVMAVGDVTIDGHRYFFNNQPGPDYGAQRS